MDEFDWQRTLVLAGAAFAGTLIASYILYLLGR